MSNPLAPPRLARSSAHRPWRALGVWLLFVVACVAGGLATGTTMDSGNGGSGDSGAAQRVIDHAHFANQPQSEQVLIRRRVGGTLSLAAAQRTRVAVASQLEHTKNAGPLSGVRLTAGRRAAIAEFTIAGDPDTAEKRVAPVLAAVARAQASTPALRVEEVGGARSSPPGSC